MKVNDIYKSIQGEGPATGEPCVFVRFAGCNLRCEGCDTEFDSYETMSVDEVAEKLLELNFRVVVLTGGEPLIQKDIEELIVKLHDQGHIIDIETNGTIEPSKTMLGIVRHLVMSPKQNATSPRGWMDQAFIKIVVSEDGKPDWTWPLLPSVAAATMNRDLDIILMPFGTDDLSFATKVWDKCAEYGIRYSDRLQWRVGRK